MSFDLKKICCSEPGESALIVAAWISENDSKPAPPEKDIKIPL
ncbi:hypothetical protein ASZ90_013855 [hydrocarbon metagenome]|jgi:hypothetical protein|uniref:Uncharacterized protein n=1 Tax=hydrocarbon metagenome TaxID=938273 RepID=A0A0W8F6F0_9ZZZZ